MTPPALPLAILQKSNLRIWRSVRREHRTALKGKKTLETAFVLAGLRRIEGDLENLIAEQAAKIAKAYGLTSKTGPR
jgi:hypothetical protein